METTIETSSNTDPKSNGLYIGEADPKQRIEALKALAKIQGIRLPNTIVPEGESLLPIGEEHKRRLECEINALPGLGDGLRNLKAQVDATKPIDTKVAITDLRMDGARGGLFVGGGLPASKSLGYTRKGFGHVVDFIRPTGVVGVSGTLLALSPAARAVGFNDFAERAMGRNGGSNTIVRTHLAPSAVGMDRRIVRAAISEDYVITDDVDMVEALVKVVPAGGHIRVTRTDNRTDIELIWPMMDRQIRVGDAVYGSVRLVNSETKSSSIHVYAQILRALCYNFTTAYGDSEPLQRVAPAHGQLGLVGVAEQLDERLDGVDGLLDRRAQFGPHLADVADADDLALGRVFENTPVGLLITAGKMWDADGAMSAGDTVAGLVNALTRASQEYAMETATEVEQAAGKVIAQGWEALA